MRLDLLLVQRGLVRSRSQAQDFIRRGLVRLNDEIIVKTGFDVPVDACVTVQDHTEYVARSALKLKAALDTFNLSPANMKCLDVGASTGGFTQLLLSRGAAHVTAVDVGRGQLHESLLNDPRVTSLEKTDARVLSETTIGGKVAFMTVDVSFISVLKVLPALLPLAAAQAHLIVLVKPQFEVGRAFIDKGGIVHDATAQTQAVSRVAEAITQHPWRLLGHMASPLLGQSGNAEFLVAAQKQ